MASNPAIAAYRSLLKAQRSLFNADLVARTAARAETRLRFMEHAGASADAVPALVQAIDEHPVSRALDEVRQQGSAYIGFHIRYTDNIPDLQRDFGRVSPAEFEPC